MNRSENPIPQYIGDVHSHFHQTIYFRSEADIIAHVEYPLIKACRILWGEKNIMTTGSSANRENDQAIIILDRASLSNENLEIASLLDPRSTGGYFALMLKINPKSPIYAVEQYFSSLAMQFKKQKMTWTPRLTMNQAQDIFTSLSYNWNTNPQTLVTEAEFTRRMMAEGKGYYASDEQLFYLSYECYCKYHEVF